MNKEEAKDFLPLVQALAEGKTIQYCDLKGDWLDTRNPTFRRRPELYRIKPEPHVLWVVRDGHGRFGGVFLEESKAAEQAEYVENARIVKYVEELEVEVS